MRKYPFKFLDAYSKEDTGIFFGRDEEIAALYEMVFQSSIILIYGASGTGKTSLIQCGLASKFQSHDWLALTIRRGSDINAAFEKALADAGGSQSAAQNDMSWLEEVMDEDVAVKSRQLSPLAQSFKSIYLNSFRPLYLIFDQFEELFILGTQEEQQQFIKTVQEILRVEQPVKMIFSIREEYLGHLNRFERAVPQLLRKKLRVEPMNFDKVREVIWGATRYQDSNVHLKEDEVDMVTEGIFDRIKGEEKTLTIQLPYLQVFLDKFYLQITGDETRQDDAVFSLQELGKIGNIGDVLRNFLEEQVGSISKTLNISYPVVSAETTWNILSPFATLEGTKEPISKQALYDRLPQLDPAIIDVTVDAFINSRILRFTEDENLYEVAHDSLAKRIAEKRSDEEIALLEIKRLVKSQTSLKADARELFTQKQLNFIEPFLEKLKLTQEEADLIDLSRQAVANLKAAEQQKQEAENQRLLERQELLEKTQKSQKRFIRWISVILIAMIGLAIWAYTEKGKAEEQEKVAKASLAKSDKLVKGISFYDDRFAVAVHTDLKGTKYGFMNKEGDVAIDYIYDAAEAFDDVGLAKVSKKDLEGKAVYYLIDTAKNEYRVAYSVDSVTKETTAAKLEYEMQFPKKILDHKQLQILLLTQSIVHELPREIGQLDSLRIIDLNDVSLQKLPAEIGQLKAMKKLLLGNNQLHLLPREMGELRGLQHLDVSGNLLDSLPDEIRNLNALQLLSLGYNQLKRFPEGLLQLKALKYLSISSNPINSLPAEIGRLKELRELYIGETGLSELPAGIAKLNQLEILDLSGNTLTHLPGGIGQLAKLRQVALNNNSLTELPAELWNCTKLNYLNASANRLAALSPHIGKLHALAILGLENNKLKELPPEISQLDSLESLYLAQNELASLPAAIGHLKTLKLLTIDGNKLTALPGEIGQLKALNELYVEKNNLTSLPSEIGQLYNLEILDLSSNGLTSLIPEIGQLKSLRQLFVGKNNITIIPGEIGALVNLGTLDLDSNHLTILPAGIGQLNNLKYLYLDHNNLTVVPGEIGQLSNLELIHLDSNRLTGLPVQVGQLKNLKSLYVAYNNLTILPHEIGQMRSLEVLDLSYNNLKVLPAEISNLKSLKQLGLAGNPFSKEELKRIYLLVPKDCIVYQ